MVVYADILFAINFIMDYLSLYVCTKVLSFKVKPMLLICSAAIGGIYSIAGLFISLPEPLFALVVSVGMCFVAFGKRSCASFIKAVILFYTTGMLFGGIMTFLYNIIYKYKNAALFKDGLKSWMFFALAGIMLVITLAAGRIFRQFMYRKNITAEITFGTCTKKVSLLCDTGNLLRDPYSDLPVIILRAECLDGILGKDGIHRYPRNASEQDALKYRLRYIPAKTAAGSSVLPAIRPDLIRIIKDNGPSAEIQALIASDGNSGSSYGDTDGIIPYSLALNF